MSKFNNVNVNSGQASGAQTISKEAVADLLPIDSDLASLLETGDSNPQLSTEFNQGYNEHLEAEQQPAMVTRQEQKLNEFKASEEGQLELMNNEIPGVSDRYKNPETTWSPRVAPSTKNDGNGGIFIRAKDFSKRIETGEIGMSSFQSENMGMLPTVLSKVNAVRNGQGKAQYDPTFLAMASLVTENFMSDAFTDAQRIADNQSGKSEWDMDPMGEPEIVPVTKASGNEQLGRALDREYQRVNGAQETTDSLTAEEATVLGDAMKEMFALSNPDMVARVENKGAQTEFHLTPRGADVVRQTTAARKQMFPKQRVRPNKSPTPGGKIIGEKNKIVKDVTGAKAKTKGKRLLEEAMENASSIANVVDRQREKIMYLTALPVLLQNGTDTDPNIGLFGDIHNMGPKKYNSFKAAEAIAKKKNEEYNPDANMELLRNKIAKELEAVAMERNGANYFTYFLTAYNGRITPQQTEFDATNSKLVRFVTRAAEPAMIKRGSRLERSLRQMYAMMLVKDADMKLPKIREEMLVSATPQLLAWGRRLRQLVDEGMSDSELEAVAKAIQDGIPGHDPQFPKVKGLALDPNTDKELMEAIAKKGEDGPHFIDGLIDFSKYHAAMQKGKTYPSYFNAYFDGKTNGLAANGVQMGSVGVAEATGVMRHGEIDLLDHGDLRDMLKDNLAETLDNDGLAVKELEPELHDAVYAIAEEVFSFRDMNKWSTMTFGYGLDISSMGPQLEATAELIYQEYISTPESYSENIEFIGAYEAYIAGTQVPLRNILLPTYAAGVVSVLDADAISSRSLMKGAAAIAGFANNLFSIKGPHGMDLHYGGFDFDSVTIEQEHTYQVKDGDKSAKRKANIYTKPNATAAAPKDGRVGGKAMGGSVPGPIQATDAATVASVLTGKTWKRAKEVSNGKPYLHTIYDAFKVDARAYDVFLEDVNTNWYNINMDWSYLKETQKAVDANVKQIKENINKYLKEGKNINLKLPEHKMLASLLELELNDQGHALPKALTGFVKQTGQFDPDLPPKDVSNYAKDRTKYMYQQLTRILRRSKEDMVDFTKDDQSFDITPQQYKQLMLVILGDMDLRPRLSSMINNVEHKKKVMDKQIKESGRPIYQYYAH